MTSQDMIAAEIHRETVKLNTTLSRLRTDRENGRGPLRMDLRRVEDSNRRIDTLTTGRVDT